MFFTTGRPHTLAEMQVLALSKTYGETELRFDCNALREFFCSESDESNPPQRARVRSASSACQQAQVALSLVEQNLERILQELEVRAGLAQSMFDGAAGTQQESLRFSSEMLREEDEHLFKSFQPILDYDIPGRSDPLDDPMICVTNYKMLLERAGPALQVRCFKSTEPEHLFNTVRGEIDSRGFLKWRVVPRTPEQETNQPHLFFQMSFNSRRAILRTQIAVVLEERVLQPMVFDAPESAGSPKSHDYSADIPNSGSEDGVGAFIEPLAEDLTVHPILKVSGGSSILEGSASSTEVDRLRQTLSHPGEVSDCLSQCENDAGCNVSLGPHQKQGLGKSLHGQRLGKRAADSDALHPTTASKDSDFECNAAGHGSRCDLEEEDSVSSEASDADDGSDANSEWSGAKDASGSGCESMDNMSGSCVHSDSNSDKEAGNRTESDEYCDQSSAGEASGGPMKRLRRKRFEPVIDPNSIVGDDTPVEHHCKEVRAERSAPLASFITEKNYTDPNRDRPTCFPQIAKDSKVRACRPGDILAVTNTYLMERIDSNFFGKFSLLQLSFHICSVVSNSDEAEELTLRRLLPLTIFGENCSWVAREGRLPASCSDTLQGPFVYAVKELDAASEEQIILKIEHSADAETVAFLTKLAPSSANNERESGDYRRIDEAGILVLCDPGKRKIAKELKLRHQSQSEGKKSALNDPQLKPWEGLRKHLTLSRFFNWADEYHESGSADGVNRDVVWRSLLYLDLTPEVRRTIGDKQAFVTRSKKSDSDTEVGRLLRAAVGDRHSILRRIAAGVERVVQEPESCRASEPLDRVSHWTTLFCIQSKRNDSAGKKLAEWQLDVFHKSFFTYCSQSLEYYIDADVAVFCSTARPTPGPQSESLSKFGFVITAWDVQIISTSLRRSCRLRVLRGENRVSYEPGHVEDLDEAQPPPIQDQDRDR